MDKAKILRKNKNIDRTLIEKNEALEKNLTSLGVQTKPKYTLSHPLNSSIFLFFKK